MRNESMREDERKCGGCKAIKSINCFRIKHIKGRGGYLCCGYSKKCRRCEQKDIEKNFNKNRDYALRLNPYIVKNLKIESAIKRLKESANEHIPRGLIYVILKGCKTNNKDIMEWYYSKSFKSIDLSSYKIIGKYKSKGG